MSPNSREQREEKPGQLRASSGAEPRRNLPLGPGGRWLVERGLGMRRWYGGKGEKRRGEREGRRARADRAGRDLRLRSFTRIRRGFRMTSGFWLGTLGKLLREERSSHDPSSAWRKRRAT